MRCPRCNAQLADNASFCGICGNALSAPQGTIPEARPPINNEATIAAAPWSSGQSARGPQDAALSMQANQQPAQPGSFQAPPAGAWSQPPAQAGWAPEPSRQPQFGSAPEMQAGSLNRAAVALPPSTRKRGRAGRVWTRLLLILVLLGALLTAAWFLGVRPYLHNLAQTELDQALSAPESQLQLAMLALPSGPQSIRGSENSMNVYLSSHDTDQIQNLHMTILPAGLNLSFTAYGQDCAITALPIVTNGVIQVTDVQVQGVLALIMSSDELTSALNSNLQSFSDQMTHKIAKITLLDHELNVQFS